MKKQALFVSAALLVASSFAAMVGGCGSDSTTPPGGATGTDSGGQLPPGTDPDSSSTSTGSNPDGSNDNNPQPDGSTNTGAGAGKTACGTTECTTATDTCCTKVALGDGGLAATSVCQPKADSCSGGAKKDCDEAADCAGGEVCCLTGFSTSCKSGGCSGLGTVQVCSGPGECTNDGGACTEYTCPNDVKVMACSKPFGCN